MKNKILTISVLIFCIIMYIEILSSNNNIKDQAIWPETYPKIILYVIFTISSIILVQSFFTESSKKKNTVFNLKKFFVHYKDVFLTFLLFGIYTFLLTSVGFIIATLLFMFTLQALLMGINKFKSVIINLCVTLSATFSIYYVFTNYLNLLLP